MMKLEFPDKDLRAIRPLLPLRADDELDQAILRIYEQYGTDLPAFFRDAYKEATLKPEDHYEGEIEAQTT